MLNKFKGFYKKGDDTKTGIPITPDTAIFVAEENGKIAAANVLYQKIGFAKRETNIYRSF